MELYIVRHGETIWNALGKLQGSIDIELNEYGRELAINLGKRLSNVDFDLIYSSPLIRAYETACLIRAKKNIQIIKDSRLKEISFGVEEGTEYSKWNSEKSPFRFFFTEPSKYIPPRNAESLENLCFRTKSFIKNEIEPLYNSKKRIMIVGHGALNSSIMCYLENRSISNFWGSGLQNNCEASIYDFNGYKWIKK